MGRWPSPKNWNSTGGLVSAAKWNKKVLELAEEKSKWIVLPKHKWEGLKADLNMAQVGLERLEKSMSK